MRNPFEYGSAVSGNAFYDRDEVKRATLNVIDGGNNVLIYGPRRYGKSSLVAQMFGELSAKGIRCVSVDMMEIRSLDVFVRRYAQLVYRALAPAEGALRRLSGVFRSLRPSLSIDESGAPSLSLSFAASSASDLELAEVLDLPERLADGRQVVVALDEFQEVSRLLRGKAFERMMRARIQHHHHVSYVFLGSRKHMLRRMFTARKEPFYNSAETFLLEKPPRADSERFLVRRFRSAGIVLPAAFSRRIVDLADNIPYYLQAIASWVYASVLSRKAATVAESDVADGFRRMFDSKRDLYETMFASFSASQCALLQALAEEPVARFDEAYRIRHALGGSSTVNTALKLLQESGDVDLVEGKNRVSDPLFTRYLRETA